MDGALTCCSYFSYVTVFKSIYWGARNHSIHSSPQIRQRARGSANYLLVPWLECEVASQGREKSANRGLQGVEVCWRAERASDPCRESLRSRAGTRDWEDELGKKMVDWLAGCEMKNKSNRKIILDS